MVPIRSKLTKAGIGAVALVVLSTGAASAIPAPDPAQVLQGSLIWNGSFDVADYAGHPLGWSVEGNEAGVNVVNRSAFRTVGLTSLQLKDVAGSAITVRSKRNVSVPDVEYNLGFDLKGEGATGTAPTATIEFWGMPVMPAQQGPLLDSKVVAPNYSTDWQHIDLSAVAPSGTIQMSVVFNTTTASTGTNHIDNVTLDDTPAAYDPAVGTDRELLVDNYRIESLDDVGRVVHPAVKDAEPMIVADKPWEKTVYYPHTVKVGSLYRMYYTCYNDIPPNYHVCLAESRDFKNWTKPNLGLVDFEGSTANNIVPVLGSVTYNPDAPADRKYVSLYFGNGTSFGYHGQISADGVHWSDLPGVDPLLPGGDVVNLTYDEIGKQYIATYKDRLFQSDTTGTYDRSAFISTSKDFLHWTPETLGVSGDVADDGVAYSQGGVEGQIYGMPSFHYGNQYLGMPWKFSITDFGTGMYAASAGNGTIAPSLASSRDLLRWDQDARGSLVEPGNPGAWNDGTLYTDNYLKITDKTVQMTYGGFDTGHGGAAPGKTQKASIGTATWRRDGFVSISNAASGTSGDPGSITTKPLTFTGKTLHLNVKTQSRGTVKVEILDPATNQPVPGYGVDDAVKIAGDRLDVPVRWKGGKTLGALAGQQIKLKIYLTGADLYSYWFAK